MILQLQIISLDEPEDLPNLVGFRLPANLLEVDKLADLRMDE